MRSATLQALTEAPSLVPLPVLQTASQGTAWLRSLPSQTQANVKARMIQIVRALPQAAQEDLARYIVSSGQQLPFSMGLGILGAAPAPDASGDPWGALASGIVGLVQAGAGLYEANQANINQRRIAASAAATDSANQMALLAAQAQTAALIAGAQRDASVAKAAVHAQTAAVYAPTVKWAVIGLGGVAVLGTALYFFRKH